METCHSNAFDSTADVKLDVVPITIVAVVGVVVVAVVAVLVAVYLLQKKRSESKGIRVKPWPGNGNRKTKEACQYFLVHL